MVWKASFPFGYISSAEDVTFIYVLLFKLTTVNQENFTVKVFCQQIFVAGIINKIM